MLPEIRGKPELALTTGAIKGRALCLHDPDDLPVAARAFAAGFVVDPVRVLVAAVLVEGVAVGAVAERAAFVLDRQLQYGLDGLCELQNSDG